MASEGDNKGQAPAPKRSSSHVKWAPEPASDHERTPLLDDDIERANEDDGDEHIANGSVSRLHRKSKLGLLLGRGGRRPSFSGLSDEDRAALKWKRWWLYASGWALLALIVIGVIIAAMELDKGDHPTGPYPGPPHHTPTPSSTFTFSMPHEPTGRPRNPAFLIKAEHAAVATENEICSDMGVDILKAIPCASPAP